MVDLIYLAIPGPENLSNIRCGKLVVKAGSEGKEPFRRPLRQTQDHATSSAIRTEHRSILLFAWSVPRC
jgi:hypothetical protein